MKPTAAAPSHVAVKPAPEPKSPLRVRTHVRVGRLFDSQNNANGFWDEEEQG